MPYATNESRDSRAARTRSLCSFSTACSNLSMCASARIANGQRRTRWSRTHASTITFLETYKRREYYVEISPRCGVRIMLRRLIRLRFFRNLQSIARSTGGEGPSPFRLSVALSHLRSYLAFGSSAVASRVYRPPSPIDTIRMNTNEMNVRDLTRIGTIASGMEFPIGTPRDWLSHQSIGRTTDRFFILFLQVPLVGKIYYRRVSAARQFPFAVILSVNIPWTNEMVASRDNEFGCLSVEWRACALGIDIEKGRIANIEFRDALDPFRNSISEFHRRRKLDEGIPARQKRRRKRRRKRYDPLTN